MQKKHYFLLAALVVYQRDKIERSKPLNILITSDSQTVNRSQLGRAQQQAQVRFYTEFDTERKSTVVDVFVQSVSYLGEMDERDFHAEFYVDPNPPAEVEPEPDLGEPVEDADADAGDAEQSSEAAAEGDAKAEEPESKE